MVICQNLVTNLLPATFGTRTRPNPVPADPRPAPSENRHWQGHITLPGLPPDERRPSDLDRYSFSAQVVRKVVSFRHFKPHLAQSLLIAGETVIGVEEELVINKPECVVANIGSGINQIVKHHLPARLQHLVGFLQGCFPFVNVVNGRLAPDRLTSPGTWGRAVAEAFSNPIGACSSAGRAATDSLAYLMRTPLRSIPITWQPELRNRQVEVLPLPQPKSSARDCDSMPAFSSIMRFSLMQAARKSLPVPPSNQSQCRLPSRFQRDR